MQKPLTARPPALPGRVTILPLTNEDTMGPYYPASFTQADSMDLTQHASGAVADIPGQRIILRGRLLDRHAEPAAGALVEFWQANADGVYRTGANEILSNPWFEGCARISTQDGRFELRTVKPGGAATSTVRRAACITLSIFSDGITRLVTQVFFEGDDAIPNDPLLLSLPPELSSRLIARHDGRRADGAEVYAIDIILAGEGETPFFDTLADEEMDDAAA